MDEDNMFETLAELERYLAGDEELPDEEFVVDTDELVHEQENEDSAPAIPPESPEDFEAAIRGRKAPKLPAIPPANPD
jgi:hypothetical protein